MGSAQHHYLKTEAEYYGAIEQGLKTFELRKNDRNYHVGDYLHLQETFLGQYTGRELPPKQVIYILEGGKYGLSEGFVIMQMQ